MVQEFSMTSEPPSKYQEFSTEALIKIVQRLHFELLDLRAQKRMTGKRARVIPGQLGEIKFELHKRLGGMDRTLSSFFPVGSHVGYHGRDSFAPQNAIVVEHISDNELVVKVEGEVMPVRTSPLSLKLLFIR